MGKKYILIAALLAFFPFVALAQEDASAPAGVATDAAAQSESLEGVAKTSSGLPIPRFVTLAAEKVFVRTGPALRYPIKWVYQRERLPVEIIQEFDTWRKIRDMDGDDGWVHQSLLSGDRSAIVKGEGNVGVRKEAQADSRIVAYLEPTVITALEACHGAWCEIKADGYEGFVERKFLWGIYDSEDFD
jgi:SH3-like domain-containing protein